MASSTQANTETAELVPLPKVDIKPMEDENMFEYPQPWYLALYSFGMSTMTIMTVSGSYFFVLASRHTVSPRCYELSWTSSYVFCTFTALCYWSYPVICMLSVPLMFAKNMYDARIFYEMLLCRLVIRYDAGSMFYRSGRAVTLLVIGAFAIGNHGWYIYAGRGMADTVLAGLAYCIPLVTFFCLLITKWSIVYEIITLPVFVDKIFWSVGVLQKCKSYAFAEVKEGFNRTLDALEASGQTVETPELMALFEYYANGITKEQEQKEIADIVASMAKHDPEAKKPVEEEQAKKVEEGRQEETPSEAKGGMLGKFKGALTSAASSTKEKAKEAAEKAKAKAAVVADVAKKERSEGIYWVRSVLHHGQFKDERGAGFRKWANLYCAYSLVIMLWCLMAWSGSVAYCLHQERVVDLGMLGGTLSSQGEPAYLANQTVGHLRTLARAGTAHALARDV